MEFTIYAFDLTTSAPKMVLLCVNVVKPRLL
jgi:hypothetical protein